MPFSGSGYTSGNAAGGQNGHSGNFSAGGNIAYNSHTTLPSTTVNAGVGVSAGWNNGSPYGNMDANAGVHHQFNSQHSASVGYSSNGNVQMGYNARF